MTKQRERIEALRHRMLVQPELCVERARIITQSFQATEGQGL